MYSHPRAEMVPFVPRSARTVLDVGCSTGAFGASLRRDRAIERLVGVEPDRDAAEQARHDGAYDAVVTATFPAAVADQFDVVMFNDVLEHMATPEDALAAARHLLRPGGVVVASIPNVRHVSVLGPLLLRGDWRYKDRGVLDATHLRFFTRRSMLRLFTEAGWRVQRVQGINRGLRADDEPAPWWVRLCGLLTAHRSDDFFFVQYVLVASDEAEGSQDDRTST